MAHAGIAAQPEVIPPSDPAVHRVSTTAVGPSVAALVFGTAVHTTTALGEMSQRLERELVLCLFSSTADRSDRGSAIPTQGHSPTSRSSRQCVYGSPRVSLREGARRAWSSSLRRRPLPCPGPALLAVAHLLLPVRRYARTWSWCLSCSRVLRSTRWRRTFRTVASHLPVFFLPGKFSAGTQYVRTDRVLLNLFSFDAPRQVDKATAATPRGAVMLTQDVASFPPGRSWSTPREV